MDASFQVFVTKSSSIVMEALPFVLLGSLVSALIHIFVSDEKVLRSIPKNVWGQIFFGMVLAVFIPSCECGIVPIVRRLNAKGVPAPMSAAYMVASPVINPVVMIATYAGFRNDAQMTFLRLLITLAVAAAVGYLFSLLKNPFIRSESHERACCCCHCGHSRFHDVMAHAKDDFVMTFAYLIIGAVFAGAFHVLVPRGLMSELGGSGALSIALMMVFAALLSVCSEADSFVASSFIHFSKASMLAFVNFGPVIDLKLIMMYSSLMKRSVILKLAVTAGLTVFVLCLLIDSFLKGGF